MKTALTLQKQLNIKPIRLSRVLPRITKVINEEVKGHIVNSIVLSDFSLYLSFVTEAYLNV